MNDAKCDSRGRLWAGSTHMQFTPGVGALHRWDGRAPSTVVATGFSLPNGLGWNAEDTVMYLADSMTRQLLSAPYSADDGHVGTFTELCTFDSGLPDGLAVDVEGCVWIAVWGGFEVQRYDPRGRLVGRVAMPVEKPSSCAFGDDGTLYITSATADIDEAGLREQPLAGSVFAVGTDTRGVPVQPFAA
jgi:sugar lactone lactonase YvrE